MSSRMSLTSESGSLMRGPSALSRGKSARVNTSAMSSERDSGSLTRGRSAHGMKGWRPDPEDADAVQKAFSKGSRQDSRRDYADVFVRGWVFVRSGLRKTSVFAELDPPLLRLRERAFESDVVAQIDARSCTLKMNARKRMISVKASSGETVVFFTDTEKELHRWYDALQVLSRWNATREYNVHEDEPIGEAETASVWRAVDRKTGEDVGIMAVEKRTVSPRQITRAKQLAETLDDDRVIYCMDVFEDLDQVYFVQEFPNGGSMEDYLNGQDDKCVSEREAKVILYHVLSAVAYLHDQGVAHRDIRLDNIVMTVGSKGKLRPKLRDLGLTSNAQGELRPMRTKVGSVNFVAPEVMLASSYDKSVDMWSCGVLAYVLLFGEYPYQPSNMGELRQALRNFDVESVTQLGAVSEECREFLCRMLARDPQERYTVHDALRDEWLRPSK